MEKTRDEKTQVEERYNELESMNSGFCKKIEVRRFE
jgi:hypothetical protein